MDILFKILCFFIEAKFGGTGLPMSYADWSPNNYLYSCSATGCLGSCGATCTPPWTFSSPPPPSWTSVSSVLTGAEGKKRLQKIMFLNKTLQQNIYFLWCLYVDVEHAAGATNRKYVRRMDQRRDGVRKYWMPKEAV